MDHVQRLTLECGHMRLSGPWDGPLDDDSTLRHMIGDMTWCEICPWVPRASNVGKEMRIWQVVNVEEVPSAAYREPAEEAKRGRHRQIHG
ncbi:hypothetical protein [Actinomadura gamaensis]|uniref:Uncharacterized protein n=1 Tax=Actinomadura gamaensis TaxID=1763541 RepID=A0ABV9U9Q3_9ACTN